MNVILIFSINTSYVEEMHIFPYAFRMVWYIVGAQIFLIKLNNYLAGAKGFINSVRLGRMHEWTGVLFILYCNFRRS